MAATRSLSATLQNLHRALRADEAAALPDSELVGRFAERRDEAAFAALVRRYGGLVFGVCRRVLRHEQDAEDAFQATFLVLARDAAFVRRAGAIGNWLYGVAHNVARKARANRVRRTAKEQTAAAAWPREASPTVPDDLSEIIDGELAALPHKYRAPVVLCDLQGLTTQQAAEEVGCPPKTLGTRLTRGRALLARRLTRRGVALAAGGVAAALAPPASAAVPAGLSDSTARAVTAFVTGSAAVSPAVAALTGVSTVMTYSALKFAALACAVLVAGAFTAVPVVQHLRAATASRTARSASAARPVPGEREPARPAFDLGDVHRFLMDLLPWHAARADDKKKDDKPKPPSGTWTKKDGEMKFEFAGKNELKISPHGKDDQILILCEYTAKDGAVKAKITGFEGKDELKKAIGEKLPVGTEFRFKWTVTNHTAKLGEVKGEKVDPLKAHLEGEYEEKK
ncbi:MAG: RNA polymerase sigma factor [Planctomycetes bacterium]|nr:RNA polymerase sigma factor [Planctomycetota bacterium]